MVSEALIQSLFVLPVSEHVQNVISQIRSPDQKWICDGWI